MEDPTSSIRYSQHNSRDHLTTQAPPLRQSRDTFGGRYTVSLYKMYCFSMAIMVKQTCLNITFTHTCLPLQLSVLRYSEYAIKVFTVVVLYSFTSSIKYRMWFQTFAALWILYVFFWVIPRRPNFVCRRFGTLCLFHLHRQVCLHTYEDGTDRAFRNVGIQNSDAGQLPRRKHTI
jgi:hypothetical protein